MSLPAEALWLDAITVFATYYALGVARRQPQEGTMASQRVVQGLRAEQFIHTEPDTAWKAWTIGAELVRWFPGVDEVVMVGDGELGLGARVDIKGAAEAQIEILEFEPSRILTYQLPTRYAEFRPHRATVQVKPSLTGTEVDWVLDLDAKGGGFLGFASPKKDAHLVMRVALEKLKELLEREAYNTPDFEADDRSKRWDESI